MIMPSIVSIFLCTICLTSGTVAWFSAYQNVEIESFQMATYTVSISVVDTGDVRQVSPQGENVFDLKKGTYTITLTANGNASTGYCILKIDGTVSKHTQQFPSKTNPTKTIQFTLVLNQNAHIEVISQWGTSSAKAVNKINHGDTYMYGEVEPSQDTNTDSTIPEDESSESSVSPSTENIPSTEKPSVPAQTEPSSSEPSQPSEEPSTEESTEESSAESSTEETETTIPETETEESSSAEESTEEETEATTTDKEEIETTTESISDSELNSEPSTEETENVPTETSTSVIESQSDESKESSLQMEDEIILETEEATI